MPETLWAPAASKDGGKLENIDLLAVVVVAGSQGETLLVALNKHHFHFTIIDSTGGFFMQAERCLLVGLNQKQLPELMGLLRNYCKPYVKYIPARMGAQEAGLSAAMIEAQVGGAVVFTMAVEEFVQVD